MAPDILVKQQFHTPTSNFGNVQSVNQSMMNIGSVSNNVSPSYQRVEQMNVNQALNQSVNLQNNGNNINRTMPVNAVNARASSQMGVVNSNQMMYNNFNDSLE